MPSVPSTVSLSPDQAAALAELYPADAALPVALQQQLGLEAFGELESAMVSSTAHHRLKEFYSDAAPYR
jgi:hypothetical protein